MALFGANYYNLFSTAKYSSGIHEEKAVLPILKGLIGEDTRRTADFHPLDFHCPSKKTWLELKQRNNYKSKYSTTIVPSTKLVFARSRLSRGDAIVFLFLFEDGFFRYDYTGQELREDYVGSHPETLHANIPVCRLVKICDIF